MLDGLSMSEYIRWQAIYETEPFPEDRADLRTAELLRMMLITGHAKQLPTIADLLPNWWDDPRTARTQTPEQMQAALSLIKAATKPNKKKPKK